jgi:hypothetical protein
VEDRDEKTGTDPEIEAHRRGGKAAKATEEAPKEDETSEASGGDESDVELHRKTKLTK